MPIGLSRKNTTLLRPEGIFSCQSEELEVVKPKLRARRKSVRFDRNVYVKETIALSDMEDDEIDQVWYTDEEYRYMRAYSFLLAKHYADGGKPSEAARDCERGLESFTKAGAEKRHGNKVNAWLSVLMEQEDQFDAGMHNEKAIAEAYMEQNRYCMVEAYERAWDDAMAVRKMVLNVDANSKDDLRRSMESSSTSSRKKQSRDDKMKAQRQKSSRRFSLFGRKSMTNKK